MVIEPVVLHGQHRIHINLRKLVKGGIVFLGTYGRHFIFKAHTVHGLPVHSVSLHSHCHAEAQHHHKHYSCHPLDTCTHLHPFTCFLF